MRISLSYLFSPEFKIFFQLGGSKELVSFPKKKDLLEMDELPVCRAVDFTSFYHKSLSTRVPPTSPVHTTCSWGSREEVEQFRRKSILLLSNAGNFRSAQSFSGLETRCRK